MSDKEPMQMQALRDELSDCKTLNKALIILAGEVSCILAETTKISEAKNICMLMGENAGRRLGKRAKKQFGTIEKVEEALDTFI
ncbi:hypothetical protein DRN77_02770, partial [Methanosarcinales archaeon]